MKPKPDPRPGIIERHQKRLQKALDEAEAKFQAEFPKVGERIRFKRTHFAAIVQEGIVSRALPSPDLRDVFVDLPGSEKCDCCGHEKKIWDRVSYSMIVDLPDRTKKGA